MYNYLYGRPESLCCQAIGFVEDKVIPTDVGSVDGGGPNLDLSATDRVDVFTL